MVIATVSHESSSQPSNVRSHRGNGGIRVWSPAKLSVTKRLSSKLSCQIFMNFQLTTNIYKYHYQQIALLHSRRPLNWRFEGLPKPSPSLHRARQRRARTRQRRIRQLGCSPHQASVNWDLSHLNGAASVKSAQLNHLKLPPWKEAV